MPARKASERQVGTAWRQRGRGTDPTPYRTTRFCARTPSSTSNSLCPANARRQSSTSRHRTAGTGSRVLESTDSGAGLGPGVHKPQEAERHPQAYAGSAQHRRTAQVRRCWSAACNPAVCIRKGRMQTWREAREEPQKNPTAGDNATRRDGERGPPRFCRDPDDLT